MINQLIVFMNGMKMDMLVHPDFLKYDDVCLLCAVSPKLAPTIMVEEVFDTDIRREYALTSQMNGIKLKGRNLKHLMLEVSINKAVGP